MFEKQFFIILVLLFPFGQLTRIPLFEGSGSVYLHDILIGTYLLANLHKIRGLLITKEVRDNAPLLLFLTACIISLMLSLGTIGLTEVMVSSFYLLRFASYVLCFAIIKREQKSLVQMHPYLLSSIILTLIFGFAQYFFFPALEPLFAAGWDRHLNRMAGTWLDTGFTGVILVLNFLYILSAIGSPDKIGTKQSRINQIWHYLLLATFTFTAILLTYSRSSYVALFVSCLIFFVYKKWFKLLGILAGSMLIGLLLLPRTFGEGTKLLRTSTIFSRLTSWDQGINLIKQKPIFGYGFNTLRYIKRDLGLEGNKWNTSHSAAGLENSLLFLLATTGIVGTGSFLYWIYRLLKQNMKDPLIIASFAAMFVHGMFANTWFYPWVILWGAILLSLKLKKA